MAARAADMEFPALCEEIMRLSGIFAA
jgi:hypothetical protein